MERKSTESGFTLIELIVVIVIVGIISYATVASYTSSYTVVQYDSMTRKITNDVNYARELAATGSQGTRVHIDTENNRYYLTYADGSSIPNPIQGGDYAIQLGTGQFKDVQITGTAFSGGRLDFNKVGTPSNAGASFSGSLELVTLNGKRRITIAANTGFLKIEHL
jgi:prepilin-type N-terminal cleavage/methylation domain-containing protein